MTAARQRRPYCWLCGRSAAKWGPLIERHRDQFAHEECWQAWDERIAAAVAEVPPLSPEVLEELRVLLDLSPRGRGERTFPSAT